MFYLNGGQKRSRNFYYLICHVNNRGQAYNYAFLVNPAGKLLPSKQRQRIQARSLLCFWAVREFGLSATLLAQKLGMSQQSNVRLLFNPAGYDN